MEAKKTPEADLQRKRGLFFMIGMAAALGVVVALFASGEKARPRPKMVVAYNTPDDVPVIMPVRVEQQAARPASAPRVEISDIMNLVSDHNPIIIEDPDWFPEDDPMVLPGPMGGRVGGTGSAEEGDPEGDIFLDVSQMPRFQGGDIGKFRSWVAERVRYPSDVRRLGVGGVVVVSFVIEIDGSVSNIEVLDAPHSSLSAEVVAVVGKSPKWEAGRQQTRKVRVKYCLPVEFSVSDRYM